MGESNDRQILDENERRQLLPIALKLCWWKTPEEALEDLNRFVAQVMALGNWAEVETVGRILGRDYFRRVLLEAPPGVFDIRSWHYWHLVFDLPVPPLPERKL